MSVFFLIRSTGFIYILLSLIVMFPNDLKLDKQQDNLAQVPENNTFTWIKLNKIRRLIMTVYK